MLFGKRLSEGPYYSNYEKKLTGDNKDKIITVKVYYNYYMNCKTCDEKGDFYDNKCKTCIDGYIFSPKSKFDNCISPSDLVIESTNIKTDYNDNNKDKDKEKESDKSEEEENTEDISESDLIQDSDANTWFNLGNNSFYIYQQNKCYLVFIMKNYF